MYTFLSIPLDGFACELALHMKTYTPICLLFNFLYMCHGQPRSLYRVDETFKQLSPDLNPVFSTLLGSWSVDLLKGTVIMIFFLFEKAERSGWKIRNIFLIVY